MSRKLRKPTKTALEILSDIGCEGFDLQYYSETEIAEAMRFMRQANPQMFDWLARVLASRSSEGTNVGM
jgi:hypothetical protein